MSFAIVNGPNLNLTGTRKPEIYGSTSFNSLLSYLRSKYPDLEILYFQSNHEGALIDFLQDLGNNSACEGVVINPGALAHYSYALADAIRDLDVPVIEVHISNIFNREDFRSRSVTAPACNAVIAGLGISGYELALNALS